MQWDPDTTLRQALWIGGGQWAGKSTVAGILAERYGLTWYHYDYHDARGHDDRRLARRTRRGDAFVEPDWDAYWVRTNPAAMAREVLAGFVERFDWVRDDLRGMTSPYPVVAEGWGLRPDLVVPVAGSADRMVILVPTDDFRRQQVERVPRAGAVSQPVGDPERAQRNRLERDRLVALDAVDQADRYGIRVFEIDGRRDAAAVADMVAEHFQRFLPVHPGTGPANGTADNRPQETNC
jgi:hypothetical protein